MAREEVAHIVKAAIWALQTRPVTDGRPIEPSASRMPASTSVLAEEAGQPSDGPSRSVSLLLGGGFHRQPWDLSNDIGQQHRLGFSILGAGRWHVFRRLQIELRLTWDRSKNDPGTYDSWKYDIRSDLFFGTLAVAYRLQWRWLSLCAGLQSGLLVVRQEISISESPITVFNPAGISWGGGPVMGPVIEMDWAVSQRIFLHLDAALPVSTLRIDDGETRRWDGSAYLQATLGLGAYL